MLSELARMFEGAATRGDARIGGVAVDSRNLTPGDLFVALRGAASDGAAFVPDAERRGAAAVASEGWLQGTSLAQLRVPSLRANLGALSAAVYGDPSRKVTLIGVTGTNGKTTTVRLIEEMLRDAGFEPGSIGTLGYRWRGREEEGPRTTPEAPELQRILCDMAGEGITHVVMECSSHGIELGRLNGVTFDVAVFTNLTQDHLDFHGTMAAYREAKRKLFDVLLRGSPKPRKVAVLNVDDPVGAEWAQSLDLPLVTYSVRDGGASVRPVSSRLGAEGTRALLRVGHAEVKLESSLVGAHNLSNLLAAVAVAQALNLDVPRAVTALARVPGVAGRLDRVETGRGFDVFVDYAHTDDALKNVLAALRLLTRNRLIAVFGCGGDRDRLKRPKMAAVAANLADVTVITSDNPRSERPETIAAEIAAGLPAGCRRLSTAELGGDHRGVAAVIVDRREAIARTLAIATPGDVVLIAGKGHETYQEVSGVRHPFDDREVVRSWLRGVR
jgi:UDP-N-acetylmuramoyl-L-alanyl-D-glutamate--2,6-diaminopimelate ligase